MQPSLLSSQLLYPLGPLHKLYESVFFISLVFVKCLNMCKNQSKNQKVEEYIPVPTAKTMYFFPQDLPMFLSVNKDHWQICELMHT